MDGAQAAGAERRTRGGRAGNEPRTGEPSRLKFRGARWRQLKTRGVWDKRGRFTALQLLRSFASPVSTEGKPLSSCVAKTYRT